MRLLILGATGGTGLQLVDQALGRGHCVSAFVRSPQKLAARHGLTVVRGDSFDITALRDLIPGHDAVLSAIGPAGPGRTTITCDSAKAVVAAMAHTPVRRLVVIGVAVLFENAGALAMLLRRTVLRGIADDSSEMDGIVKGSALDWTIVRAPRLTHGSLTMNYRVTADRLPPGSGGLATVSRADLAHFLIDEVEKPRFLRQVVGIAYARR